MREPVRNMGASVRARLLKLSRERNQPFELLLTRYVLEWLLYRLSTTKHCDRFVLKGAMLAAFREIFAVDVNDGVQFDVACLTIDNLIREAERGCWEAWKRPTGEELGLKKLWTGRGRFVIKLAGISQQPQRRRTWANFEPELLVLRNE